MANFVQFNKKNGTRALGKVVKNQLEIIYGIETLLSLAQYSISKEQLLSESADDLGIEGIESYDEVITQIRL